MEEESVGSSAGVARAAPPGPDILLVGEIRDEWTAKLTTHAMLTGHLNPGFYAVPSKHRGR